MKIELIEFSPDAPRHEISRAKAKRLVEEFKVAIYLATDIVKLIVDKSWSVIKTWLRATPEQIRINEQNQQFQRDFQNRIQAQNLYPNGAQYGFNAWPSRELRTVGV